MKFLIIAILMVIVMVVSIPVSKLTRELGGSIAVKLPPRMVLWLVGVRGNRRKTPAVPIIEQGIDGVLKIGELIGCFSAGFVVAFIVWGLSLMYEYQVPVGLWIIIAVPVARWSSIVLYVQRRTGAFVGISGFVFVWLLSLLLSLLTS